MATEIKHLPSQAELSVSPPSLIQLLETGDRLTRHEFEARYHAMPDVKKAELIEGIVYMPSPTRFKSHAKPHALMMGLLFAYASQTPGVEIADNASVRLDPDNEVQPDALLFLSSDFGGRVKISQDDYLEGAPELILEVAASSVSYDLHDKIKIYRRNQVFEYVIWRVLDQAIDWFILENEVYQPLPNDNGMFRSRQFPGLWIDAQNLLAGNAAQALDVLNRGLASDEHRALVETRTSKSPATPPK
ncbi:MAG: Uma2 family endonuclease [Acidobacteria bacterium]|nr:Uma2 family endonuclease [Acidobacteriota bacterium]